MNNAIIEFIKPSNNLKTVENVFKFKCLFMIDFICYSYLLCQYFFNTQESKFLMIIIYIFSILNTFIVFFLIRRVNMMTKIVQNNNFIIINHHILLVLMMIVILTTKDEMLIFKLEAGILNSSNTNYTNYNENQDNLVYYNDEFKRFNEEEGSLGLMKTYNTEEYFSNLPSKHHNYSKIKNLLKVFSSNNQKISHLKLNSHSNTDSFVFEAKSINISFQLFQFLIFIYYIINDKNSFNKAYKIDFFLINFLNIALLLILLIFGGINFYNVYICRSACGNYAIDNTRIDIFVNYNLNIIKITNNFIVGSSDVVFLILSLVILFYHYYMKTKEVLVDKTINKDSSYISNNNTKNVNQEYNNDNYSNNVIISEELVSLNDRYAINDTRNNNNTNYNKSYSNNIKDKNDFDIDLIKYISYNLTLLPKYPNNTTYAKFCLVNTHIISKYKYNSTNILLYANNIFNQIFCSYIDSEDDSLHIDDKYVNYSVAFNINNINKNDDIYLLKKLNENEDKIKNIGELNSHQKDVNIKQVNNFKNLSNSKNVNNIVSNFITINSNCPVIDVKINTNTEENNEISNYPLMLSNFNNSKVNYFNDSLNNNKNSNFYYYKKTNNNNNNDEKLNKRRVNIHDIKSQLNNNSFLNVSSIIKDIKVESCVLIDEKTINNNDGIVFKELLKQINLLNNNKSVVYFNTDKNGISSDDIVDNSSLNVDKYYFSQKKQIATLSYSPNTSINEKNNKDKRTNCKESWYMMSIKLKTISDPNNNTNKIETLETTLIDITSSKKLIAKNTEAKLVNTLLLKLCHEIKTPLMTISHYTNSELNQSINKFDNELKNLISNEITQSNLYNFVMSSESFYKESKYILLEVNNIILSLFYLIQDISIFPIINDSKGIEEINVDIEEFSIENLIISLSSISYSLIKMEEEKNLNFDIKVFRYKDNKDGRNNKEDKDNCYNKDLFNECAEKDNFKHYNKVDNNKFSNKTSQLTDLSGFFIKTDKGKLFTILINIIKNSIKFTNYGKIEVILEICEERIYFTIEDTGIGLNEEIDFKRILGFSDNYLFSEIKNIDKDKRGTQMGLKISNLLLKKLSKNSTLEVINKSNQLGKGVIVRFSISRNLVIDPICNINKISSKSNIIANEIKELRELHELQDLSSNDFKLISFKKSSVNLFNNKKNRIYKCRSSYSKDNKYNNKCYNNRYKVFSRTDKYVNFYNYNKYNRKLNNNCKDPFLIDYIIKIPTVKNSYSYFKRNFPNKLLSTINHSISNISDTKSIDNTNKTVINYKTNNITNFNSKIILNTKPNINIKKRSLTENISIMPQKSQALKTILIKEGGKPKDKKKKSLVINSIKYNLIDSQSMSNSFNIINNQDKYLNANVNKNKTLMDFLKDNNNSTNSYYCKYSAPDTEKSDNNLNSIKLKIRNDNISLVDKSTVKLRKSFYYDYKNINDFSDNNLVGSLDDSEKQISNESSNFSEQENDIVSNDSLSIVTAINNNIKKNKKDVKRDLIKVNIDNRISETKKGIDRIKLRKSDRTRSIKYRKNIRIKTKKLDYLKQDNVNKISVNANINDINKNQINITKSTSLKKSITTNTAKNNSALRKFDSINSFNKKSNDTNNNLANIYLSNSKITDSILRFTIEESSKLNSKLDITSSLRSNMYSNIREKKIMNYSNKQQFFINKNKSPPLYAKRNSHFKYNQNKVENDFYINIIKGLSNTKKESNNFDISNNRCSSNDFFNDINRFDSNKSNITKFLENDNLNSYYDNVDKNKSVSKQKRYSFDIYLLREERNICINYEGNINNNNNDINNYNIKISKINSKDSGINLYKDNNYKPYTNGSFINCKNYTNNININNSNNSNIFNISPIINHKKLMSNNTDLVADFNFTYSSANKNNPNTYTNTNFPVADYNNINSNILPYNNSQNQLKHTLFESVNSNLKVIACNTNEYNDSNIISNLNNLNKSDIINVKDYSCYQINSLVKKIKKNNNYNKSINNNIPNNILSNNNNNNINNTINNTTINNNSNYQETINIDIPKIVICDDYKLIRKTTKKLVSDYIRKNNLNYEIVIARDGIELLYLIMIDEELGNNIKLILCDENMAYINGSDAYTLIQKMIEEKKVSRSNFNFITTTAYEDAETMLKLKKIGINRIITKPLNRTKIEKIFEELIGNK